VKRKSLVIIAVFFCLILAGSSPIFTQDLEGIQLPKPQTDLGRPLMQVLRDRHSSRAFSSEKLSAQVLSNLLWAAFGVNRPETGGRTAPSAMNWQEMDLYVVTGEGVYLYEAKANLLKPVVKGDLRSSAGTQPFVQEAPLNLVYVSDYARISRGSASDKDTYTAADAGFISQNVYLFCASEGLATVVRGSVDRPSLAKAFKLRPDQRIILAQTVGRPKREK
jgi:SagB-type dehydrogenase family enzyme